MGRAATFNLTFVFVSAAISDLVVQRKYPSNHLVDTSFEVEFGNRMNIGGVRGKHFRRTGSDWLLSCPTTNPKRFNPLGL